MTITTLSGLEFGQHIGRAKKAALTGPVFITDRGKPAYVLLGIEEYRRLTGKGRSIIDMLAIPPGVEDVEIEFPSIHIAVRPVDLD